MGAVASGGRPDLPSTPCRHWWLQPQGCTCRPRPPRQVWAPAPAPAGSAGPAGGFVFAPGQGVEAPRSRTGVLGAASAAARRVAPEPVDAVPLTRCTHLGAGASGVCCVPPRVSRIEDA